MVKGTTVAVCDHGPGIDPNHLADLFRRSWRGSTKAAGTSLGLPVALRSAKQAGGVIAYRSRPGGGSVFKLVLSGRTPTPLAAGAAATIIEGPDERGKADRSQACDQQPLGLL